MPERQEEFDFVKRSEQGARLEGLKRLIIESIQIQNARKTVDCSDAIAFNNWLNYPGDKSGSEIRELGRKAVDSDFLYMTRQKDELSESEQDYIRKIPLKVSQLLEQALKINLFSEEEVESRRKEFFKLKLVK